MDGLGSGLSSHVTRDDVGKGTNRVQGHLLVIAAWGLWMQVSAQHLPHSWRYHRVARWASQVVGPCTNREGAREQTGSWGGEGLRRVAVRRLQLIEFGRGEPHLLPLSTGKRTECLTHGMVQEAAVQVVRPTWCALVRVVVP